MQKVSSDASRHFMTFRVKANSLRSYTSGIEKATTDEQSIQRDLYRNRALINLQLRRFEQAKADALASISDAEDDKSVKEDSKALYRAANAAYSLRDWSVAKELYQRMLKKTPSDKDGHSGIKRCIARLRETEGHMANIHDLRIAIDNAGLNVDHADFLSNTEIRTTKSHGQGLFAAVDMKPGDIILYEKALVVSHEVTDAPVPQQMYNVDTKRTFVGKHEDALSTLSQMLFHNPKTYGKVADLDAGDFKKGKLAVETGKTRPVDIFRLQRILELNIFNYDARYFVSETKERLDVETGAPSTGLWYHASYINHSCLNNAAFTFIGDLMVVRAIKPIAKNTEILIAYIGPRSIGKGCRKCGLRKYWGFTCTCALCKAECGPSDTQKSRRNDYIYETVNPAMDRCMTAEDLPARVKETEGFVAKVEKMYSRPLFKGLPRLELAKLYSFLSYCYRYDRTTDRLFPVSKKLLQSQGYRLTIHTDSIQVDRTNGILDKYTVGGFMSLSVCFPVGSSMAKEVYDIAHELWVTLTGSEEGFISVYTTGIIQWRNRVDNV